ncbi:uncharacterized protein RSE6_04501 [Rhynchosporium secalis]|uniref:Helicase ATP-binding domain-containing protein n=1 Tax=Rhynchosporium secalis TaxID=38038 RepID=A0A1E1M5F8_RHYSE|nr:uncharacterized protein RSE6_04501 [Rhynchosporium secalis]
MSHQLLPVGDAQNKLCRIATGNKSSLSILVGPHGSGKTTQMPSIVSKPGPKNAMCRSLVTQPNILSAQAPAEFMTSKPSKFAEGKLIGLVDIIRRPKSLSQPRSVITFIPDDILNNWLSTDQGMERLKDYKMIFIDDCHYKSIQTEHILLRIKTIMTASNQATYKYAI